MFHHCAGAPGGWTLHQLRHSRLTHLGEDGWSAAMLMGLSGHTNLRSLGIYTTPVPRPWPPHSPGTTPPPRHR
ncbi:tyrosine-type recombinase/integrase [Spongiactinospora sp. 9N601]|uniref:tyrosine-type recombinase/integrase n=1 Tax=Spongiactinospora sp. 9N601 TaxID=3375149 RepID=UPI003797C288